MAKCQCDRQVATEFINEFLKLDKLRSTPETGICEVNTGGIHRKADTCCVKDETTNNPWEGQMYSSLEQSCINGKVDIL